MEGPGRVKAVRVVSGAGSSAVRVVSGALSSSVRVVSGAVGSAVKVVLGAGGSAVRVSVYEHFFIGISSIFACAIEYCTDPGT